MVARPSWRWLLPQVAIIPAFIAELSEGISRASRTTMMVTTTRSSMSVKPRNDCEVRIADCGVEGMGSRAGLLASVSAREAASGEEREAGGQRRGGRDAGGRDVGEGGAEAELV